MNAAFCFESSVEIGATMMVGTATAGRFLEPLPPPPKLEIMRRGGGGGGRGRGDEEQLSWERSNDRGGRMAAADERRLGKMQAEIEVNVK